MNPLTRRIRTLSVAAALILTAALTGCTGGSDADSDTAASPTTQGTFLTSSPSPAPDRPTAGSDASSDAPVGDTPVVLQIDGTTISARLEDSAASASLLAQLPLTLLFRDFDGQEKVAELPEPLDLDGAPAGSNADPGMIGYYVPDQRLILYYDQVGYYAGIVPLGTFDDVPTIERLMDGSLVTIRAGD